MNDKINKQLILIVDDTPLNIRVLAEALSAEYRVKVASSGHAALDIIASQGLPDLILLDVMMPEMDGYEVCRQLKQNVDTKRIPVIFVTAKTDVVDEEMGLKLGAVDYITKPFHMAIVKARVRNQINLKLKTDLLESYVMLDGLTNISNRRRFDEVLDVEWKRAQRSDLPFSLIMADIDYFKLYNDHYGHAAGDLCLKKVAAALNHSISRPSDVAARYGGEEFSIILPDTDDDGAYNIAEYFRSYVEELQIPHIQSDVSEFVTVSVGLACCITPGAKESPSILIEKADQMLYLAKESGRNRVCQENKNS
jgi:diguanylate cyclase (GGDEF)-like protein